MDISLVYMVAGLSSRYECKIKQFASVGSNDETLIEYSLNQALKAGFNKIIFIVGNKTELAFKEKFRNNYKGVPVFYALQKFDKNNRDKPWGTCDSLCSAKKFLDSPFVICNGDDLYGQEAFSILVEHLKTNQEDATVAYKLENVLPEKGKVSRAILTLDGTYLKNLEETHNLEKVNIPKNLKEDSLCSINIFALHLSTLMLLENSLINFKKININNRKIECYLPLELSNLIKEEKIKIKVYKTKEKWCGITNPGDEKIIKEELSKLI